jgi:hypothetical protein
MVNANSLLFLDMSIHQMAAQGELVLLQMEISIPGKTLFSSLLLT